SCLSDPAPPLFYALSLHDALPIFSSSSSWTQPLHAPVRPDDRLVRQVEEQAVLDHAGQALQGRGQAGGIVDAAAGGVIDDVAAVDRKSTRLNSSHVKISYAVFCLK